MFSRPVRELFTTLHGSAAMNKVVYNLLVAFLATVTKCSTKDNIGMTSLGSQFLRGQAIMAAITSPILADQETRLDRY